MTIRLADISEFQPNIDAPTYLDAGYKCLIVRAHNGYRLDHMWPGRRDYLRRFPFVSLGWYQYLVADRSASDQAHDFIAAVGDIRPSEFVILDHEDEKGTTGQVPRAQSWFEICDSHYGKPSTLYSGESFGNDVLGGWARWAGRPRWIAAYRSTEPSEPHDLWQHSESASFPGISGGGVDGNIFHGTPEQFAQTFAHHSGPVPQPKGSDMIASVRNKDGRQERFVALHSGAIKHNWQDQNFAWQGWVDRGNVGGTPLGISANLNNHDCVEVCVYLANGDVKARWQTEPGNGWSDNWTGAGHPGA